MRLKFGIAFNLAFIACLSSFLLGLGSSTHYSTVLVFLAAIASLYLTDLTRTIQLNRFVSNILIITIVFFSLGSVFRYQTEDIAIGIARLLQMVQIVVLFQEKNSRNRWHILMISFLQVVVATAFQQSLSFGLLLLLYVFANLSALTLIYLHDENDYFKKHSFVRGAFQLQSSELRERQDMSRLMQIAVATFIVGPLSLLLFYRENELEEKPGKTTPSSKPQDAKFQFAKDTLIASRRRESQSWLTSLFSALFTTKATSKTPLNQSDSVMYSTASPTKTHESALKKPAVRWETGEPDVLATSDLWEDVENEESSDQMRTVSLFHPKQYYAEHIREREELSSSKWPLIHLSPIFSGGTDRQTGVIGRQSELYTRLAWATIFSLFVGAFVFLITPRFNEIEVFGQRLSHDRWRSGRVQPVSSVGFTEDIRLGSLGNVLQNYQEVLSISFSVPSESDFYPRPQDRQDRRTAGYARVPYTPIAKNEFYLRGVVVEQYESSHWSKKVTPPPYSLSNRQEAASFFYSPSPFEGKRSFESGDPWVELQTNRQQSQAQLSLPWWIFPVNDRSKAYFDPDNDLVQMRIVTQPLDTNVLFTVWPFFILGSEASRITVSEYLNRIEIPEVRRRRRPQPYTLSLFTTAFRKGIQTELIPCMEMTSQQPFLQIPRSKLPKLCEMAQKWDNESRLSSEKIIERARNLSDHLKNDGRFQYQLGGIVRDSSIDPLEDFVANNPRGHCEFFAGALAMMLRSVNIPSRICIGYKAVAELQGSDGFIVRQSDAHTWVEAYIPPENIPAYYSHGVCADAWKNGGWLRLDATPDQEETLFRSFSISLSDFNFWIQNLWRNYVLNMDGPKQTDLVYAPIRDSYEFAKDSIQSGFGKNLVSSILHKYTELFQGIRQGSISFADFVLIVVPLAFIAVFVYLWNKLRIFQRICALFGGRSKRKRKRQASIEFYRQLEKLFSKIPVQRLASETQREFVRRSVPKLIESLWNLHQTSETTPPDENISQEFLQQCANNIVDAFYRIRFGNETLSDKEIDRIVNDLHLLKIAVDRI